MQEVLFFFSRHKICQPKYVSDVVKIENLGLSMIIWYLSVDDGGGVRDGGQS